MYTERDVLSSDRAIAVDVFFFFQAEDGIRDLTVTGVQTCALPILRTTSGRRPSSKRGGVSSPSATMRGRSRRCRKRSEEHTSELQSQSNLVCRLLLEKKKKNAHALSQVTHRNSHVSITTLNSKAS